MSAGPTLMGHRQAVLRVAETLRFVAIEGYDDAECSRVSTSIAPVDGRSYDRVLEVGPADSRHAAANLVECVVHFRASGGIVGVVLMGIKHGTVRRCDKVKLSP